MMLSEPFLKLVSNLGQIGVKRTRLAPISKLPSILRKMHSVTKLDAPETYEIMALGSQCLQCVEPPPS